MNKFIIFLLVCNFSFAQTFTRAKIKPVEKDGMYVMKVPSLLRSYSNNDLGDLRIYDSKKQEIPYFVYKQNQNISKSNFEILKIVSKTNIPNQKTEVIFENSDLISNNFIVEFANTQVQKKYEISGSNDLKIWFGLINKDSIYLEKELKKTSIFYTFDIPLNNYKYIKLILDDQKTLPVNILNLGIVNTTYISNKLDEIQVEKIIKNNDAITKKTIIEIIFKHKEVINQIFFDINNPKFFLRNAIIYTNDTIIYKKKTEHVRNELAYIELKSLQKNSFIISSETNVNQLFIEIDNQDNLPLSVDAIKLFQNPEYIVSEMYANENYIIETGKKGLFTPSYDLKYFENTFQNNIPVATIYDVKLISHTKDVKKDKKSSTNYILWICVTIGAAVAFYFVAGLMKEIKAP